jgi:hypothetical protein
LVTEARKSYRRLRGDQMQWVNYCSEEDNTPPYR